MTTTMISAPIATASGTDLTAITGSSALPASQAFESLLLMSECAGLCTAPNGNGADQNTGGALQGEVVSKAQEKTADLNACYVVQNLSLVLSCPEEEESSSLQQTDTDLTEPHGKPKEAREVRNSQKNGIEKQNHAQAGIAGSLVNLNVSLATDSNQNTLPATVDEEQADSSSGTNGSRGIGPRVSEFIAGLRTDGKDENPHCSISSEKGESEKASSVPEDGSSPGIQDELQKKMENGIGERVREFVSHVKQETARENSADGGRATATAHHPAEHPGKSESSASRTEHTLHSAGAATTVSEKKTESPAESADSFLKTEGNTPEPKADFQTADQTADELDPTGVNREWKGPDRAERDAADAKPVSVTMQKATVAGAEQGKAAGKEEEPRIQTGGQKRVSAQEFDVSGVSSGKRTGNDDTSEQVRSEISGSVDVRPAGVPMYGTREPVLDSAHPANDGMLDQVSHHIVKAAAQGKQTVKLNLKPEELGEIAIDVECENGKLSLVIEAKNQTTGKIIENQLDQLGNKLNSSNYQVMSMKVHFSESSKEQWAAAQSGTNSQSRHSDHSMREDRPNRQGNTDDAKPDSVRWNSRLDKTV